MTDEPVLPKIRPEIAQLPPYKQGKPAPKTGFKLSSNENPFDPLPSVVAAVNDASAFNRYPDATAQRLRAALAAKYGTTEDGVIVGAGSVALLAAFIQAAATAGDEVIYAWRSFEAYPGLARVAGAIAIEVPLLADARHDLDAMARAVTERTRAVIVCTPNNPTGPIITADEFESFVASVPNDVLILLDEAYAEFVTDADAVDGLASRAYERHPNVVVLRTFSKAYGLAGLRVGYGIGHPRLLDAARSTIIPLSVTAQAEAAALASLEHQSELGERVAQLAERRDALVSALRENGWQVPKAQGNFIWLPDADADRVATFEQAGLIVRPFPEGIRISVGEDVSIDRVIEAAARP
ncbi:MAG: histidinol-phosphate transaminase [Microbacterium sp.]